MSFSKYNVNALTDPLSALPSPIIRRSRQNSVFVGSSTMPILNPAPRRVKSAMDIQHLVVNENKSRSFTGSLIPIINRDRRPSISIERAHYITRRRPSMVIDRSFIPQISTSSHRTRRSSCFVERPVGRHRNFISFEYPIKMPNYVERPSSTSSFQQPKISVEAHVEPAVTVQITPGVSKNLPPPKLSRSFEHPSSIEKYRCERMATSLDVTTCSLERRYSIPERDLSTPVFIFLDETRITAPLLESLKSSDV